MSTTAVPAVEGWFTTDAEPHLLGTRCTTCGTVFFPRATGFCRNPECRGRELAEAELSRTGTVWSYTDAQYQPPPPYIPPDEDHVPFAIAAVELAEEQMVILGQVATGYGVEDLAVGTQVELVVEPVYEIDGVPHLMCRWKPASSAFPGHAGRASAPPPGGSGARPVSSAFPGHAGRASAPPPGGSGARPSRGEEQS